MARTSIVPATGSARIPPVWTAVDLMRIVRGREPARPMDAAKRAASALPIQIVMEIASVMAAYVTNPAQPAHALEIKYAVEMVDVTSLTYVNRMPIALVSASVSLEVAKHHVAAILIVQERECVEITAAAKRALTVRRTPIVMPVEFVEMIRPARMGVVRNGRAPAPSAVMNSRVAARKAMRVR